MPDVGVFVARQREFDLYTPAEVDRPLPAVILVPGPVPADIARPRDWPVYTGYGRLLANRDVSAAVVELPYHAMSQAPVLADRLAEVIDNVRSAEHVDSARIAVWAFSGGARLMGRWLASSPAWLRCIALTYPVLGGPESVGTQAKSVRPGRPIVLTRVGRELPQRQATVDEFLAVADRVGLRVDRIDVPDGRHGFDLLDHTEQSRDAVLAAVDAVVGHLLR
ncbi:MAG: hypothetical protein J2O49_01885 [Sciscionella sp.]|nr:hypothetical protein [Sciscionella sp.]